MDVYTCLQCGGGGCGLCCLNVCVGCSGPLDENSICQEGCAGDNSQIKHFCLSALKCHNVVTVFLEKGKCEADLDSDDFICEECRSEFYK